MIAALTAGAMAAAAVVLAERAVAGEAREHLLGRAGWRRASRADPGPRLPDAVLRAVGAVAAWLLGGVLAGVVGSVAAAVGVLAVPPLLRRRRETRRALAAEEQLADAVSVMALGLRAGRSLVQAIELAAAETEPPLGPSFRRLADRASLGDRLDDALGSWTLEVTGADARLAAGVIRLHRRTGGAIAAALEELASTLRARRSAARELRSLTAQARLSATILGLLPLGFFLFLWVVAREDLQNAYRTPMGVGALALGLTLQALAYLWIRRLLRVEP